MPAIATNQFRILNSDLFEKSVNDSVYYVFFGGTTPWEDESTPPDAIDCTSGQISALEELIGLKRISSADVISVIRRIDWVPDVVYDEYIDNANIIDDENPETDESYNFYVFTDEFNVYKCISNNNRANSTIKPTGTSISSFTTPDGYIWKFMYNVRVEDAFKFITPNWIPCYTLTSDDGSSQWQVQSSAIAGSIEHIIVTDSGAGYSSANPPSVNISGDGTSVANAIPIINDVTGEITKIIVVNIGGGYTNAEISIVGGTGVGASAIPVLSPIGGHGSNAREELGATKKMIRVVIENNESEILETNVSFRKSGILQLPLSNDDCVELTVSDTSLFQIGETVVGDVTETTGTIRLINKVNNILYVEVDDGLYSVGETISSQTYNETELLKMTESKLPLTANVVNSTNYFPKSGNLIYFSNREKITRGENQTEEFRFVVSF